MLQITGPFLPAELEYRRERILRDYPRTRRTVKSRSTTAHGTKTIARLRHAVIGRA